MNDLSYKINWNSMSDQTLAEKLGEFVKEHRLNQNKSQEELAKEASISRCSPPLRRHPFYYSLNHFALFKVF